MRDLGYLGWGRIRGGVGEVGGMEVRAARAAWMSLRRRTTLRLAKSGG
jgi:hypothetical protein